MLHRMAGQERQLVQTCCIIHSAVEVAILRRGLLSSVDLAVGLMLLPMHLQLLGVTRRYRLLD